MLTLAEQRDPHTSPATPSSEHVCVRTNRRKTNSTIIPHNKDIIKAKRSKTRGEERDKIIYSIDENAIKYHIELNTYSNKKHKNYHREIITQYEVETVQDTEDETEEHVFLDD